MTATEFTGLSYRDQIIAIGVQGREIAKDEDELNYYVLHVINGFFIEETVCKADHPWDAPSRFTVHPSIHRYLPKNSG